MCVEINKNTTVDIKSFFCFATIQTYFSKWPLSQVWIIVDAPTLHHDLHNLIHVQSSKNKQIFINQ